MAKQTIGVGSSANDGTGDTLRAGAGKINANFTEVYAGLITIGGAVTFTGSFTTTLTVTANTTVTLPVTGTLATLAGSETFTNKTHTSPILNSGTIGTILKPTSDDGAPLGDSTHHFSDLFLATGAVVNFQNGDVLLTHSSGILTLGTGDLRITTAGTNAASVVTVGGTQTLTGKTISAASISVADAAAIFTGTTVETVLLELAKVPVKVTASNYTIGATDSRELYGGVIYVTGAATITIPAVAAGASFTVVTIGAVAVSVDPNAADLIYLDGVALSDGDKITNLSTAGDVAVFTYYDATGWSASTNGWTDGN